jgi:O-antigen/teichoic acid export membrane protein
MGYLKDTIKGVSWMGGFRLFSRLIALGRTAILARLLLPAQFGVYGIAVLALAFLEIFTETGINVFLIQEKKNIDEYINTAWVVSIVRGILISFLIILATPLIISFFNSPDVRPLLLLISLVPFLRGFINPSIVKFQKELQFNKEFWFRSSIFIFDSTVAVILVLLTHSPVGLIYGLLAGVVLEIILSFIFVKPTPKFAFEKDKVKEIIGRGKWVTASGVFGYLTSQGDDAVVAKILNTTSLGLYQMAYRLSMLPGTEITEVASKVTFPVYVRISADKKRLLKAYIKTVTGVALLVIPVGLILFVFPEQIINIVLGNRWIEAAPALKILAIFGAVGAIAGTRNVVFYSLKRQDIVARISFIKFLVLAVTIIPLTINYGIIGAALSSLISVITILPFTVYYLIRVFR